MERMVCAVWNVQCGAPDDAQLDGVLVAEYGQTPAKATQCGFRRMGRASTMTGRSLLEHTQGRTDGT